MQTDGKKFTVRDVRLIGKLIYYFMKKNNVSEAEATHFISGIALNYRGYVCVVDRLGKERCDE